MTNFLLRLLLSSLFTLFLASSSTSGNASPGGSNTVTLLAPDAIKWTASAQLPGAQIALVDGNPKTAGLPYTLRLKLPDGYTIPLHWHPDTERLTVLTGVVLFGAGDKIDPTRATAMGPGSYIIIPAKVPHWVTARGPTIFQVSGVGPFTVHFVK